MLMNVFNKYDVEKSCTIWGDDDKIKVVEDGNNYIIILHNDMENELMGSLNITNEQAIILSDILKNMVNTEEE